MRTEKWYDKHLRDYFYKKYSDYEYDTEWFVNPANNQWKFYILKLGLIVVLTCDEDGNVSEKLERVGLDVDQVTEVIEAAFRGCDALYEDHIINLVGVLGLNSLRDNKILGICGSIDGRRLYTLNEH